MTEITLENVEAHPAPLFEMANLKDDLMNRAGVIADEIAHAQRRRLAINSDIREWRKELAEIERVLKAVEGRKPRAKK